MKKILEKSGIFVRGKKWEPCKHSSANFMEGRNTRKIKINEN